MTLSEREKGRFADLSRDSVIGMATTTEPSHFIGLYMKEIDGVEFKPMTKHAHDQVIATKPFKPGGMSKRILRIRGHDLRKLPVCTLLVEPGTLSCVRLLFQTHQAAPLLKVSEDQVLQSRVSKERLVEGVACGVR